MRMSPFKTRPAHSTGTSPPAVNFGCSRALRLRRALAPSCHRRPQAPRGCLSSRKAFIPHVHVNIAFLLARTCFLLLSSHLSMIRSYPLEAYSLFLLFPVLSAPKLQPQLPLCLLHSPSCDPSSCLIPWPLPYSYCSPSRRGLPCFGYKKPLRAM